MFPSENLAGLTAPLGDLAVQVAVLLLLRQLLLDAAVGIEPLLHLQASLVVDPSVPGWPEQRPPAWYVGHSVPQ